MSVGFFFKHFHAVAPISAKCAIIAADIPREILVISKPQFFSSKYPIEIWKFCLLLLENQSITEYNHEKPVRVVGYRGRDANQVPTEYKPEALLPEPACWVQFNFTVPFFIIRKVR